MNIIYAGRGKGKTTQAIRIANENNATLVVPNATLASEISHLLINCPMTFDQVTLLRFLPEKIVIDNVDLFLKHVCHGSKIIAMTATRE